MDDRSCTWRVYTYPECFYFMCLPASSTITSCAFFDCFLWLPVFCLTIVIWPAGPLYFYFVSLTLSSSYYWSWETWAREEESLSKVKGWTCCCWCVSIWWLLKITFYYLRIWRPLLLLLTWDKPIALFVWLTPPFAWCSIILAAVVGESLLVCGVM